MKKKKRGQSFPQWFALAMSTLLFGLVAMVASPFVIPSDAVFVTHPWQYPHEICTTQWVYPEETRNDPELMQAVANANLPVDEIVIWTERAVMDCYGADGTRYSSYDAITIIVDSNETALSDNVQIGNLIHEVVATISSTETSQQWGGIDLIGLTFTIEDVPTLRWRTNYVQALRATQAGMTGMQLFEIGHVR